MGRGISKLQRTVLEKLPQDGKIAMYSDVMLGIWLHPVKAARLALGTDPTQEQLDLLGMLLQLVVDGQKTIPALKDYLSASAAAGDLVAHSIYPAIAAYGESISKIPARKASFSRAIQRLKARGILEVVLVSMEDWIKDEYGPRQRRGIRLTVNQEEVNRYTEAAA